MATDLIAPTVYNMVDEIEQHAKGDQKIALIVLDENGQETTYTYKQIINRANQIANVLTNSGLQIGDIVLIMLPRSVEAYATYIGALKAGITIIPSSDQLRAGDIDYRVGHAGAKAIIVHENYLTELEKAESFAKVTLFIVGDAKDKSKTGIYLNEEVEGVSEHFEGREVNSTTKAFLAYTSGTTGSPKGAVHTHAWGYAHLRTTAKSWLGVEEGDVVWATAAPGWQKWIWSPFLAVLGSGATAFVYKGKFEATVFLQLIERYSVNVLCCTPTEYRLMIKKDNLSNYKFPQLRSAVSAGEPLNREVIERFKEAFDVQVRDGYGQTENTLLVGTLIGMEPRPGSMGKPTPGNHVDLINGFGEIVAIGEVGDIAVHRNTPALFKGYYKEPERTSMQFRGDWYVTGDRARKDEDGYFWFEGRSDDMIISAGYTIGPFEIEDALLKHPLVQECAVVASPDEIRGSIVKAFVVLKDFAQAQREGIIKELQDHVKAVVAPYSYPRKIEFLEELPKTISGKIRRVELRKREALVNGLI